MATVWELDFYSRPILDENQKKRWEVLLCEGAQSVNDQPGFRYSQYLANTEVNSIELKKAIQAAIDQAPTPPVRIRFFRYQMQNMIKRASEDLGLPVRLSRRTLMLQNWLDERRQQVYPNEPGYQGGQNPSVRAPIEVAQPLPDALIGQQWTFVSLPAQDFDEMPEWDIDFGEGFPLPLTGVDPQTPIPGIIIFSQRATPLAAWMSGLELGALKPQIGEVSRLLLETGTSDTWILERLSDPALIKAAKKFEAAKQQANGVHFVAVQASAETDAFAGFWLMQSREFG
ncbi:MAG: Tab2/Atab2 family RNA-binding protein [Cyanobacteria bacterium J06628_6]